MTFAEAIVESTKLWAAAYDARSRGSIAERAAWTRVLDALLDVRHVLRVATIGQCAVCAEMGAPLTCTCGAAVCSTTCAESCAVSQHHAGGVYRGRASTAPVAMMKGDGR